MLDNVDPYFNSVRIGVLLAHQIWDRLIYRDPATGEYKGQLATSWKWIATRRESFTTLLEFGLGIGFDRTTKLSNFSVLACKLC